MTRLSGKREEERSVHNCDAFKVMIKHLIDRPPYVFDILSTIRTYVNTLLCRLNRTHGSDDQTTIRSLKSTVHLSIRSATTAF